MDKRSELRGRARKTLARRSFLRTPVCEQLEGRFLLSADSSPLVLPVDSVLVRESMAEGESSLPELEIEALPSLSVSTGTGYKAQSKVWQHDGTWWAAVGSGGTKIWRLDGTKWTAVLTLSSTAYRTDVKSDGDLVHVLLFPDGPATKLVSAEYNPTLKTYQLWSQRPQVVDVPLKNGVRIATLDIDSTGRMWIAADTTNTIELHYSEPESNYSVWKGPVTIGTGVNDGDISVVTNLHNGSIGVLWSNQVIDRFLFREHHDLDDEGQRNDPADWEPLEIAAGEAALKVGNGMADDHLNVAVSVDGTLYAGVKTGYDNKSYTEIGTLVRRPNGTWDPKLYHVSYSGTRPIIVLNDTLDHLMVIYDNKYHESLTDPISFGPARTLPLGSNATSTKQNWVDELVVLGGGKAVMIKTDAIANSPPIAVNDSYLLSEDQLLTVAAANGVLDNDSDAQNDPLTSTLVTSTAHGSLTLQTNGSFSYTPTANYFGDDSFTYRAHDGVTAGNLATVSITVAAVNDAPLAEPDSYSVNGNQLLSVAAVDGVLSNDSDQEGGPLTVQLVQDVAHGSLTLNTSNGAFTYQPNDEFSGSDTFTYKAHDGTDESATATVTIIVNAPPIAADDTYELNEDQFLAVPAPGVLFNDSDSDGDNLTAELASDPNHGTLDFNSDGSFTYQPHQDYSGTDSFIYVASDGVDGSLATVTINVSPVNDPPAVVADPYTVEKGQFLSITAPNGVLKNDFDVDGDPISARLMIGPAHGILSIFNSDGSFTYIPEAGFEGPDNFTYVVNDGIADSAIAAVSIAVVNTSVPVTVSLQDRLNNYSGTRDTRIRADQATTNFGTASKLELDGNPDQVSLIRWDMTGIPAASTVLAASITVNVVTTSNQDFEVYEGLRDWDELKATYFLAATGQPWALPGAAGATDHASEILAALTGTSLGLTTIQLNAEGVAVVQKWISDPSSNHGFVIQDLENATTDDLDFSSREASGLLGPKITVTYRTVPPPPTNNPPLASTDSYQIDEDTALLVTADMGVLKNDSDPDGDPLQAALVSSTSSGELTMAADGSFSYEPNGNFHGLDKFIYRAVDSLGNVSPAVTASITVQSVNDPPAAADQSLSTPRETAVSISLSASDVDGDSVSYVLDAPPSFGSLTGTAPDLSYVPNVDFIGSDSFTFHAFDGTLDSAIATVSISVTAINRAPVADEQSVTTDEDQSTPITLTGSDLDGDTLTFLINSAPVHGSLSGTAPDLTYTPTADFHGSDSFSFQVNDGSLDSSVATVSITVSAQNDPPIADDLALVTPENTTLEVILSGSDIDGDSLSYSLQSAPTQGTLSGIAPNLTYIPNAAFVGDDSFTFEVNDGSASSNIATVSIQVTPAREPEDWSFQDGSLPTTSYAGTVDASVRSDDSFANFGSRTSLWLDGAPDQAAFVRWDLTEIPAGSIVHSASITLNIVTSSLDDYPLYEMLAPWLEHQITYMQRSSGEPWQIAGAQGTDDRGSTVLGILTGPTLGETVINLNSEGVEAVQRWINSPAQNQGVVFQDFNNANTDDLDFASSEAKVATTRPKLTISVTLPSAPPTAPLMTSPLRNQANPLDVDNNGSVTPTDVLVVFNALNRIAEGEEMQHAVGMFPDVSGDGAVSPLDALLVINFLNRSLVIAESEGDDCVQMTGGRSDAQSTAFPADADSWCPRLNHAESLDSLFSLWPAEENGAEPWSLDLEEALQELTSRIGLSQFR